MDTELVIVGMAEKLCFDQVGIYLPTTPRYFAMYCGSHCSSNEHESYAGGMCALIYTRLNWVWLSQANWL